MKHKNKAIQGSKGASKTYSILQRWLLMCCKSNKSQLCTIVSDTLPNLKTGAIRDFGKICASEGLTVQATKSPHVFIVNNWTFEFFSVDKENKGLGGRRDRLFINEANRVSWKIARQLIGRTHKECIFDYNPVESFWVHEQFVDVNDCDFVKLTYKDNQYLPINEIEAIEKHAPWGTNPDENFWRVYGLGEIGYTENMVFKNFKTFKDLPEGIDYQETVGIDWGGRDPQASAKVYCDHKNKRLYWIELFYVSMAYDEDMFKAIIDSPHYKEDIVLCDHNPLQIMKARDYGLDAFNANKKINIVKRLSVLKNYEIFVHEDSENFVREMKNYKYQERSGTITNYPDQKCDEHLIDAATYASIYSTGTI
jgi:phage terminase large subunit